MIFYWSQQMNLLLLILQWKPLFVFSSCNWKQQREWFYQSSTVAHTPQTSKLEPEASRSALLRMQMVRRFCQTSSLERVLQNTLSKNDARSPVQRQPLHRRQLARALGKLLIYWSGCKQGAAAFSAARFESLMGNLIEKKQGILQNLLSYLVT